jgi:hypothetical protein
MFNSTGSMNVHLVPLMTLEDLDAAIKKTLSYRSRSPGGVHHRTSAVPALSLLFQTVGEDVRETEEDHD